MVMYEQNPLGGRGWFSNSGLLSLAGIQNLLNSLQTLSPRLEGREKDLQFLQDLVNSNEFHSLMQVYITTLYLLLGAIKKAFLTW